MAPGSGGSGARWVRSVLLALGGVAAGALLAFWWLSRSQPAPATPAPIADVPVVSTRPKRQLLDLPALNDSDTLLRSLVSALSQHPTLARLLATPALVRGATVAVVQIGDGRTPDVPLRALRPADRAQMTTGAPAQVDPSSYARWEPATSALLSVSPKDAAQLYVNVKPLFDEAYIELGHTGGDFDTAATRAIVMLRDTPPALDAVVVRRPGYFDYDDPGLRALKPVQKQYLLLGPARRSRMDGWLRQFAAALDLRLR